MEFGKLLEKLQAIEQSDDKNLINSNYLFKIKNMINMFKRFNYEPYEINGYNKLEYSDWRHWPWDVYFRQCDKLVCLGHHYKVSGSV
jgi:predicted HTH transcriptional regulator